LNACRMLPVWARLASTSTGLRACAASANGPQRSRRYASTVPHLPGYIQEGFQYASESNFTAMVESAMEAAHTMGLPWMGAFVATGVVLRIGTAPFHIYAEKLFARRMHATNFFSQKIMDKLAKTYHVKVGPNKEGNGLQLLTDDENVKRAAEKTLTENVSKLMLEHRLQSTRITNLKVASVPVWVFSSFAVRNIISADFHPSIAGFWWIPDLLVPDPYFIIPVLTGAMGFFNLWAQRKIYPLYGRQSRIAVFSRNGYDAFLFVFTCAAVQIMTQMPVCIPLYWLSISVTGFLQAQLLRHPKVKKTLDIQRLPTDSSTPIRDLFLMRRIK
ncbi:hypothetical protein PMAYCL1PPCAC_15680, partial [Pristionchus mayeri]